MQTVLQSRPVLYRFPNLESFTHEEATLWNWMCCIGPAQEEWSSWIADILGHLVEHPDGIQLRLVQSHSLEADSGETNLTFGSKHEVLIGRDAENDIVLPAKAISKRHARLTVTGNRGYLEDLGGKLGTYLWDKRMPPNEPRVVRDGDQFSVFPYRFRVTLERCWSPEKQVGLGKCHVHLLQRGSFLSTSPLGWKVLVVNSHPAGESLLLTVNPLFMTELRRRILAPLGLSRTDITVPSDAAVFGFVTLALLERFNRCLKSPMQFSLARAESKPGKDATHGMLVSAPVMVGGLATEFRAFLPLELLAKCMGETALGSQPSYPEGLGWKFPVASAFVDLLPHEMEQVAPGDILVTESRLQVLFPNDFSKGWFLTRDLSNPSSFLIDKYFERSAPVEAVEGESTDAKPDLASLPVRVHVIVGQREFTVAEINSLKPGMIVELHAEKSDPVRLMVNGKILGDGELVEVDGQLAVKVRGWRSA